MPFTFFRLLNQETKDFEEDRKNEIYLEIPA